MTGQDRAGPDREGRGRTGKDRVWQGRAGQHRTGQDRTELDRAEQGRTGQSRTGQSRRDAYQEGARIARSNSFNDVFQVVINYSIASKHSRCMYIRCVIVKDGGRKEGRLE